VKHVYFEKKIAEGAFGDVWDGRWGGVHAAVKVLKQKLDPELSPELGEEFARECETLCSITHPHLLIFYGAGETAERKPFMVTEFMEGGSLRRALADHSLELSIEVRLQIGQHIALAMEYLHGIQIVHRDLKSDNCLLDAELNAKVADFGTSKFIAAPRGTSPNLGSPASPASNGGSGGPAAGPAASALTRMSHPNRPEWPRGIAVSSAAQAVWRDRSPRPDEKMRPRSQLEQEPGWTSPSLPQSDIDSSGNSSHADFSSISGGATPYDPGAELLAATMTKGVGTPLWMAAELFVQYSARYGPEVDVYS